MKVIISGTTGVGKSTTVNLLKEHYEKEGKQVTVLSELVVDNPFFDLYFNELENWGFLAQVDFLMQRFKQWVEIEQKIVDLEEEEGRVIIYDRHFLEDLIFAELRWVRANTSALLSKAYRAVYDDLVAKIEEYEKPEFFILLRASFDTVKERQFVQRGRTQEELFSNKYWQDLYYRYYASKKYRGIFKENTKHFVEIDTDDSTPNEVVEKVVKYINKRKEN